MSNPNTNSGNQSKQAPTLEFTPLEPMILMSAVPVDMNQIEMTDDADFDFGTANADYIDGKDGDDFIAGSGGNDMLLGGAGDDYLAGEDGNDHIDGGDGNDLLEGGEGNDTVQGGAGDDTILAGVGNDVVDGGEGFDVIDYYLAPGGVDIDLTTGHASHGPTTTDFTSIEAVMGSQYDDVYRFTQPTEGAAYVVLAGYGENTIDLSQFASNQVEVTNGHLRVQPGNGEFEVLFHNVSRIIFADGTQQIDPEGARWPEEFQALLPTGFGSQYGVFGEFEDSEFVLDGDNGDNEEGSGNGGDNLGAGGGGAGSGGGDSEIPVAPPSETSETHVLNASGAEDTIITGNSLDAIAGATPESQVVTRVLSQPFHGTVSVNEAGIYTYQPNADFFGVDTFVLEVINEGRLDEIIVSLEVTPVSDLPRAEDDSFNMLEDSVLLGNVMLNDFDVDGDALSVAGIFAQPEHGHVTIDAEGNFRYEPRSNYQGQDRFTYQLLDAQGATSTGEVIVNVFSVNDAPVAVNDQFTGQSGVTVVGNLLSNDSDVDGDVLSFDQLLSQPTGGTISVLSNGQFSYTPLPGFVGTDSFEYVVRDGNGATAVATVTIEVEPSAFEAGENPTGELPALVNIQVDAGQSVAITLPIPAGVDAAHVEYRLSGLPAGATMNNGLDLGNGGWRVRGDELAGLTLSTNANVAGDFDISVHTSIRGDVNVIEDTFDAEELGWTVRSGVQVNPSNDGLLGPFSGTGGQQGVFRTYSVPAGLESVVVEFDFLEGDSWDGERFLVFGNDSLISSDRFYFANRVDGSEAYGNDGDRPFSRALPDYHRAGSSGWSDQVHRYRIEVPVVDGQIKLGFGSTLNQSLNDESWAIDNLTLSSNFSRDNSIDLTLAPVLGPDVNDVDVVGDPAQGDLRLLMDVDNTETQRVTSVVVSGLSNDVQLNGGQRNSDGSITLVREELENLRLTGQFSQSFVAEIRTNYSQIKTLYAEDFENGAGGWSANTTQSGSAELTSFLGRFNENFDGISPEEAIIEKTFAISPDVKEVIIEFDQYEMGDWGGDDQFVVFINGEAISAEQLMSAVRIDEAGKLVLEELEESIAEDKGFEKATDRIKHYALRVAVNGPLTIGFGANLNVGVSGESWGIDNLQISYLEQSNQVDRILIPGVEQSGEPKNLIVNGSFEIFTNAKEASWGYATQSLAGWALESGTRFEPHKPRAGISATDGNVWMDMGLSPGNLAISQQIEGVEDGKFYELNFDLADSVQDQTDGLEVYWNGEKVADFENVGGSWVTQKLRVEGGSGDGSNTLVFRGTGDSNNFGVSLDNVQMFEVDGLFEAVPESGVAGEEIRLGLDLDEQQLPPNSVVIVSELPKGAIITVGTDNGNGTWTLTAAEAETAALRVPTNISGEVSIRVSTQTVEDDAHNFIVNGSFEDIGKSTIANNGWQGFKALPGWTLESGSQMEIVDSGHRGVEATDGSNWLDMDASPGNIAVSQVVSDLSIGQTYQLSFDTINTLRNGIADADNGISVYFGGEKVLEFKSGQELTVSHTVNIIGGSGDGSDKLRIVGLDETPDNIGLALDNVKLRPYTVQDSELTVNVDESEDPSNFIAAGAFESSIDSDQAVAQVLSVTGDVQLMEYGTDGINFERNETESSKVLVFAEPGRVVLEQPLRVDAIISGDGNVGLQAAETELAAGKVVESYFLHFDTPGTANGTVDGSITFDRPISALIFGNQELRASDFLARDVDTLEAGDRPGWARAWDERGESISISDDGRTISFTALTNVSRDEMRIIFADEAADDGGLNTAEPELFVMSQDVLGLTEHQVYSLTFDIADPDLSGDVVQVFWAGELVGEVGAEDVRSGKFEVQVRAGSGDGSDTLELRSPKYQDGLGVDVQNIRMVDTDTLLVNGSFENLTGTVDNGWGFSGKTIQGWTLEENGTLVAQENFEEGAEGWSDNRITETDHEVLTDFLGKFGGSNGLESVSKTFDLQGDHNYAVMEFDFLKLDSWDSNTGHAGTQEALNIFVNGVEIVAFQPEAATTEGRAQLGADSLTGVSGNVRYVITSSGQDTEMQGAAHRQWGERVYHVRLEMVDPGEQVKLGFGSTLNQSISDESFGIDNVTVFGADNPNTSLNADGTFSASGNAFEVHNPRGGVVASDGDYWLDMGGSASNVTIAQQIPGLTEGTAYTVAFDLADSAHDRTDGLQVIWNGEVIAEIDGQDITMDRFEFEVKAGSGDGSDTLKFRGTGEVNNFGVSLDDVTFTEGGSPLVEAEAESIVGSAGTTLELGFDLDETVIAERSTATVSGVPENAMLSSGTRNADGTWTVPADELEGLSLRTPTSFAGTVALSVELNAVTKTSPEMIVNGSFEDTGSTTIGNNSWKGFKSLPGWTLESGPQMEVVDSGHRGVEATDGSNWLDMDASPGNIGVSQVVTDLNVGETYQLSFDTINTLRNGIADAQNGISVFFAGEKVLEFKSGQELTVSHTVNIVGDSGDGSDKLVIVGLDDTPDGIGLALDNVQMKKYVTSVSQVSIEVAVADDPTNLIANGSFENTGDVTIRDRGWAGFQKLEGWTLESGQQMEVVDSGHRGVEATDGDNWLDMDASPGPIIVSQEVLGLETGKAYDLSFDTINTLVGGRPADDNGLAVFFGGKMVLEIEPGEELSESHVAQIVGGAGDGSNKLVFVGLDSTSDGIGSALDNVRLEPSTNLVVNGSFENLAGTRATGYGHASTSEIQGWRLEENATLVANEDFENGASGWSNNQVTDSGTAELTSFLGKFGGSNGQQAVSKTFDLAGDHKFAVVEFDFLKLDSWDSNNAWGVNERLNVFLNDGNLLDFTPEGNIRSGAQQLGLDGMTGISGNVRYTITSSGSDQALSGHNPNGEWHERVYHVRLEIVNPGADLKLGFGSTLNQGISDESFGIDNVKVFGADNPKAVLNADGSFSAAGNAIEVHNDGQRGIEASDGEHWLDLGGSASNVTVAQNIEGVVDGEPYVLSFDLADSSQDLSDGVEVIWNGEVVAAIEGQDTDMSRFEVQLTGGSGDGSNVLKFRGTGDVNNFGVSLDNVRIEQGQIDEAALASSVDSSGVKFAAGAVLATELEVAEDLEVEYSGKGGLIWGDPHFVGDDGGKYDVQGEAGKIYNLLSDNGLQLNSSFKPWLRPGTTVLDEIGLTVGSSRIQVEAFRAPTFDGIEVSSGQSIRMDNVEISFDGKNTVVKTDEYTMVMKSRNSGGVEHMDIQLIPTNPFSDKVAPHGLWGLTVDADTQARHGDGGSGAQGGGAIDTVNRDGNIERSQRRDLSSVALYETNDLFSTKAKNADGSAFFRFNAELGTGLFSGTV